MQNAGGNLAEDVGSAILIKSTVRGLQAAGHNVIVSRLTGRSVLQFDDIRKLDPARRAALGLSGTQIFQLVESGTRRIQRELKFPYFALFDSYRFYEACIHFLPKFDLCHEYGGVFSLGAALACWRLNFPYVLSVEADTFLEKSIRGESLKGIHAGFAALGAKFTYRVASRIITVSQVAKLQLVEKWVLDPDKIVVIPNGVDARLFATKNDPNIIREEFSVKPGPVIGFVGGFQPWHGLEYLVEVFALVLEEVPAAQLLLVGDGISRPIIERKMEDLGIESSVVLTGFVPQNRVPDLLSITDVAVLPYPKLPKELWFSPLKLYEYMAAEKAIVASRSGQIAEVIRNGHNGILVDPEEVSGFSQAIINLLRDPVKMQRLGKNAREQAVREHSWFQHIQRLEDVYRDVLEESRETQHV
ncbi:MAG: glycosyltransferase family 4 protein [Anaerolineales bacterium]|jgi:glycosyltransferase involved in cell wall biosynthesis